MDTKDRRLYCLYDYIILLSLPLPSPLLIFHVQLFVFALFLRSWAHRIVRAASHIRHIDSSTHTEVYAVVHNERVDKVYYSLRIGAGGSCVRECSNVQRKMLVYITNLFFWFVEISLFTVHCVHSHSRLWTMETNKYYNLQRLLPASTPVVPHPIGSTGTVCYAPADIL